jgi:PAS domain S-box-containing protein
MTPHIAVILTDARRRIQWVNQDFTVITGYSIHEVVGRVPGKVLQGPETEPAVVSRIRQHLDAEIPLKEVITNYKKNGEKYKCRLVIYPVFNPRNELTNYIAFEVNAREVPDDSDIPLMQLKEKYETSSLKGGEEVQLFFRLKDLMNKEKLFLKPDLHLRDVATLLKTNTKYLSQVVNHQSGNNFQHFINNYRIVEARKKILDPDYNHLTLYGIALQCGFKNKSTFYKVFKEITGLTPRAYIQEHNSPEV